MRFTRLIEYLHSLSAARVSAGMRANARIALLDNLGCGLFGAKLAAAMQAMLRRAKLGVVLSALTLPGFVHGAGAADFPSRPVRMIVPFPAGGGTDVIARLIAAKLAEKWQQSW